MTTPIDLSRLPPPDIIEALNFEALFEARKAALLALFDEPERTAMAEVLALESEPLTKHLQENAYREMILRQRINEAAVAGMLAANRGADLDGVASRYETLRMQGESDDSLRHRTQLAFYLVAAAGPRERYQRIALDAHPDVTAVDAWQESPGVVRVALLTRNTANADTAPSEDATLGQALYGSTGSDLTVFVPGQSGSPAYDAARFRLTADDVQPVGVDLRVSPAIVIGYSVEATVIVPRGPDPNRLLALAKKQLEVRVKALAAFRVDIYRHALIEALLPDGARTVELTSPPHDIPRGAGEIAVCTSINLSVEVRDD